MEMMRTPLSKELETQLHRVAREQKRPPAEVLEDAVREYLARQSWVSFVEENSLKAGMNGISEDDVERLIAEIREEKRVR